MTEPKDVKLLAKDRLKTWLGKLQNYRIFAPVQHENYSEFAEIQDISTISEIFLDLFNTTISPKDFILPQTECMFGFNTNKKSPEIMTCRNDDEATPNRLVLGIRPCDSLAIAALDCTFDTEFKDTYYLSNRNRTVLIGLACQEPDENCFCTSVGSDPHDGSALDIMLVDLGDSYLFKIYTEKGQQLIDANKDNSLFEMPSDDDLKTGDDLSKDARAKITRKMATAGKPEKLSGLFESGYWDAISKKCLGCGICTYLCPTCYCFDITDEKWGTKGERVRTWDSCMYPEYTAHASGYNPRPARMNRMRNRVYHKFKYYPDLHDKFGCVGCGRCISYCPVNVDIIDIINGIDEVNE